MSFAAVVSVNSILPAWTIHHIAVVVSVNSILPAWTIHHILEKQTTFSIMEIISFRFHNVSECCLQQVNDDYHDGHVIVF